ncbi:MAG: fimbrillin family protein [Mediterranea massiliensis]|nr:fimbrillin family protein [Mediterranea massiliensis]
MRNLNFILWILSLIFVLSCNDEENYLYEENLSNGNIIITACLPQNGTDTRLQFADEEANKVLKVDWNDSNETISVISDSDNKTFAHSEGNNFTGVCPSGSGCLYALYPTDNAATASNASYDLSSQSGDLDENLTYMTASNTDFANEEIVFNFAHLTALLKPVFKVNDTDVTSLVKSVTIELPNGVYSKGSFDLRTATINDGGSHGVIQVDRTELSKPLYIYLPMGINEATTINFIVTTTDSKEYSATLKATKNISPGKVYLATINLEENVAGSYIWKNGITASSSVSGNGTQVSPYLIHYANDLQWLINNVGESEGKYYKLTHHIIIDSSTEANKHWTPIGTSSVPFKGFFDGNNNKISGQMISQYATASFTNNEHLSFGFFGWNDDQGNIERLHLNAKVIGGNIAANNGTFTAAVVGHNTGKVAYCINSGDIQGGNATEQGYCEVGGIVGDNLGEVLNCSNSGFIIGGEAIAQNGYASSTTGGIVGTNFTNYNDEGLVKECTNVGMIKGNTVTVNSSNEYSYSATGGIAGANLESIIELCYNKGIVNGGETINSSGETGGIAGYNRGETAEITSCINYSLVDGFDQVGGVVGYDDNAKIQSCKNYAMVTSKTTEKNIYTAGIVANKKNGTICGCLNDGLIVAGSSNGENNFCYTGGVVGYTSATIDNCINNKDVYGGKATFVCTGGILGYTNWDVQSSVNNGNVYGGEANGTYSYTGGVVGSMYNNTLKNLSNCENHASVTGGNSTEKSYTGGIVGYLKSNVYKCINGVEATVIGATSTQPATGSVVGYNNAGKVCLCCKNKNTNLTLGIIGGGTMTNQTQIGSNCDAH